MTGATSLLRRLAKNQLLANARLARTCFALQPGEWEAPRVSFFPSLKLTMEHLLNADRYYVQTISPGCLEPVDKNEAFTLQYHARERERIDLWYVDFCKTITPGQIDSPVTVRWPQKTFDEKLADLLLHVFLHGQHHRGQIHAMLSGTSLAPPQIDEFILANEGDLRQADLAFLGWTEEDFRR